MILDLIIGAILLITGVAGLRRGFVYTFIHTAGWIISIVLAFIATPYAKDYILKNTNWYDRFIPSTPVIDGVPKIISDTTSDITSNLIFVVILYLLILIAIKIILSLILSIFSKDYREGFTGFFDGFLGMIVGLIKGILLVFVFLAIMIPVSNIFMPNIIPDIIYQLDHSYCAKTLYDNNFLVVALQNFFYEKPLM